ncbi:MAG: RNA-binding protein [Candidatus Thiodiazotropha sp.]|jgi:RNA recognition motif-containing protein
MKIYVGNLPWSIKDNELHDLFTAYGEVASASVIMDKFSGRSKGFGFVEMTSDGEAESAMKALNEKEIGGRNLRVNEARPREDRQSRKPRHLSR